MVFICVPSRLIICSGLVSPHIPTFSIASSKKFQERARRTPLNNRDNLVRFAGMLALLCANQIHLRPCRSKCAVVFTANSEQENLCNIPEIKPYATTVWLAIFPDLFPDDISFILESPRFHYSQAVGKECVWHPKIQVAFFRCDFSNRKIFDLFKGHGFVAIEFFVLRGYLAGSVLKTPRRISINGCVLFARTKM